jgi:hypothetical protein
MTACTVTLCDDAFAPVRTTKIDIEAYDPAAYVSIDKQSNSKIQSYPETWGAILTVGSKNIYNAVIDTTGTSFAPNVIENLNGSETPKLDVILFSISAVSTPKVAGPTSSSAVQSYVQNRDWPLVAKKAVFSSIRTYSFLRALPPSEFKELREHLEQFLLSVRIEPDLIA